MTSDSIPEAQLLRRYDRPGPRYTSYPTAPQFSASFGETQLREAAPASNGDPIPRRLSLYVHVPFCVSPCFYCGCNRIITRDTARGETYLARLYREIDLIAALFDRDREVIQLHFGGGTPNFLSPAQLREVVDTLRGQFRFSDSRRARHLDRTRPALHHARRRRRTGRDRLQPRQPRRAGFRSGGAGGGQPHPERGGDPRGDRRLPRARLPLGQRRPDLRPAEAEPGKASRARSTRSIDMRPDRLAVYGYAHLPDMFKAAAPDRRRRPAGRRKPSCSCCSWRSRS